MVKESEPEKDPKVNEEENSHKLEIIAHLPEDSQKALTAPIGLSYEEIKVMS